ncbi:hypothetical protein EGW08_016917, partial [Elysia chlorotica]
FRLPVWRRVPLTLFIVLLSVELALAARKVEIWEKDDSGSGDEDNESGKSRRAISSRIVSRLNLGANVDVQPEDSLLSAQGNTKKKYSETYKGYKVFNTGLDVEEDASGGVAIVAGDVYADIEGDLGTVDHCDLPQATAKKIALRKFGLKPKNINIVREAYDNYVYIDSDNVARWAVDVELSLFKKDKTFSRPVVFIDACSQEILDFFDRKGFFTIPPEVTGFDTDSPYDVSPNFPTDVFTDLFTDGPKFPTDDSSNNPTNFPTNSPTNAPTNSPTNAPTNSPTNSPTNAPTNSPTQGPTNQPPGKCDVRDTAGNPKRVVKFGPGEEFCLTPMRRSSDGSMCYLENQYVKTVDLKGREDDSSTKIASFRCSEGYDDEKNGGFSPVLDAFFFCTASSRLYR